MYFTLRCTAFDNRCTAYAIMYIRNLTWVYCTCQQVYCICHHVHQEPHLGVLHLPSSVLQWPSCTSGASPGYTAFAVKCTAYAIMYIWSHTGVYYISQQVYCSGHHVFQEPHLGVQHLPTGVLHMPSCTSGTSLECTAFASKCTVLHMPSCISGARLGRTAFAIKCTAVTTMYFRSLI